MPEHNQAIAFDTFVENATRAAQDPSTTTTSIAAFDVWAWMEDKTGIVLGGLDENDANGGENVTKKNGEWTYKNVQYWTPKHEFYFVAVAPMDSENWEYDYAEDTIAFTNVDGTEDLICAYKEVDTYGKTINSTYDTVALKFAHLLSKVKFTFQNGFATNNMSVEVSEIAMTAPESATFNIKDNEWGTVADVISIAYGDVEKTSSGQKNESTYERFTIPASDVQEYVVTYTITIYRGEVADYTVTKTSTITGVELEKGKAYNFVAEISPETLNMQEIKFSVVVDEWLKNGQDNGNIAEAELRAAAQLGAAVTLTEDVVLSEPLNVVADMTINMEGKTLTGSINVAEGANLTVNGGTIVNTDNTTSGIISNGKLELNNVNVTSARHALRIESGDVVINGGEYRVAPISNSTLYALNVGDGANSVANVIINDGTFVGPKGTMADSGGAVTVKVGSSVKIYGGDFSGGKTKTLSCNGSLVVYGGTFDQDPAAFVAEGYYASKMGDRYHVADAYLVADKDGLQEALNAEKAAIRFVANIEGDVTNTQKPGVVIAVDGDGYNYAGVFTVDGKSAAYANAGLTLKNITFNAATISADACVRLGVSGDNNTRYTANVTIDNCTFDVLGAVAVKSYTGGDKNLTITNCTTTANVHSLVQIAGIDGVRIEGCNIQSVRGMNFNSSNNVVVNNCVVNVKKYAARFGANDTDTVAEVYSIKNSSLTSACEEGDAVIILRGNASHSTLTIENTPIEGPISLANEAVDATVIVDGNEVTAIASSAAELTNVVKDAQAGDIVIVAEGTYVLPTLAGKEGVVIIGTEGTVIGGDNASTGFGSNFGKNNTIKNVTFSGTTNGVRWSYAKGGETIFENCTFAGGSTYGFHIDESNGATFKFNNCVFSGFNAFAGDLVSITFDNCTFEHNGNYGHTNIWSVAYFNDCTWETGTSVSGGTLYFNGVEENWMHNF